MLIIMFNRKNWRGLMRASLFAGGWCFLLAKANHNPSLHCCKEGLRKNGKKKDGGSEKSHGCVAQMLTR